MKAAPKTRPDRTTEKPRRIHPPVPTLSPSTPLPTTPPQPSQADLDAITTTTPQLTESVRLLQAQQQHLILETQKRRIDDQQMHAFATPIPSATTPPSTTTPPLDAQPPQVPSTPAPRTTSDDIPPTSAHTHPKQPKGPISISPSHSITTSTALHTSFQAF